MNKSIRNQKNQEKKIILTLCVFQNKSNLAFFQYLKILNFSQTVLQNQILEKQKLYFLMNYKKSSFTSVIILTTFLYIALPVLSSIPGLLIDRMTLSSQGATHDYNNGSTSFIGIASHVNTFHFSWREVVPAVIKTGLCVNNYRMNQASYFFDYFIDMQNVTTNGMDVYLQTSQGSVSWVYFLTFNIVLVTVDSPSIELVSKTFNFNILNVWNRTNSIELESFVVPFTKFNSSTSLPQIKVMCGLTYMIFDIGHSQNQSYFYFFWQYTNNSLNITFISFINYNALSQFMIFSLAIDCGSFLPNLVTFQRLDVLGISYWKPTIFDNSNKNNSSIFSIVGIHLYQNQTGSLVFTVNSNLDIISLTGSQPTFYLESFYLNSCPINYFVNYTANSSQCILCRYVLTNCINCTNGSFCILCKPATALISHKCVPCFKLIQYCAFCLNSTKCQKCFIGFLVVGGCTTTVGCIQVVQVMNQKALCYACDSTFFTYNYTDYLCYCKQGIIVGEYCTTVLGCTATTMIGSTVVCAFCNISLHLQLKNSTCVCIFGYEIKNGTCVDICGDGLIFTSQCDDGNVIDGDGCSSQCKPQFLFKCTNKDSKPSLCSYYGLKLNISLVGTQKVQSQNQAVFSFSFQPDIANLAKVNLNDYFFFNIENASYSAEKWVYSKGFAYLYVNYSTPLQGKKVIIDFNLQNQYIHHTPIQLNQTIKSTKGGKILLQKPSNSQQKVLSFILFAFSGIGIFLVVFCSWLHKMIGVQFLFVSQVVYYAHFSISEYDTSISILQYLCFSSFNYRAKTFSLINFTMYPQFQTIQFSSSIADATLLTLGIIVLLPLLFIVVLHIFKKRLTQKIKSLQRVAEQQLVWTQILSPLLLSYTFPFLFISATQLIRGNIDQNSFLSSYLRAIIIFFITSLYCLNLNHFTQRLFLFPNVEDTKVNCFVEEAKDCYLFVFQLLMLSSFVICCLWIKMNLSFCLLAMIGLFGTMFLWQLIVRPYENVIDNIGITLNILVVLVYLILVFLRNSRILEQNQANSEAIRYASITGLALCCLFSIIRLILAIRRKLQKKHLGKLIKTKNQPQKVQAFAEKSQKGKEKSQSKKSFKNMKQAAIIQSCDRVMPILQFSTFKKEQKEMKLSKEYHDMVQNYRKRFRKNKLATKINPNEN